MKTIILLSLSLFSLSLFGQATKTTKYYLTSDAELGIYRHINFLKSIENAGGEEIEDLYSNYYKSHKIEDRDLNKVWYQQEFFNYTENESEAQAILSATYHLESGEEEITKTIQAELPYYMTYKKRYANVEIIRTINYTDDTPSFVDTINVSKTSDVLPGKKPSTIDGLKNSCIHNIKYCFDIPENPTEKSSVSILFPKIKIKDKALKEEYSNIQGLLRHGEYSKAGLLCKKIAEAQPKSLEAKAAVGLCYELIGNYPEALKNIKPLKDFHLLSRSRKNMKLLEYAQSIGFEPEFAEFE